MNSIVYTKKDVILLTFEVYSHRCGETGKVHRKYQVAMMRSICLATFAFEKNAKEDGNFGVKDRLEQHINNILLPQVTVTTRIQSRFSFRI